MEISDQIRLQCSQRGSEPALSLGGSGPDCVSYAKLGRYIDNLCSHAARISVKPGSIYGLMIREPLLNIVTMLALERLGATTVSLKDYEQAEHLAVTAIVSDQNLVAWKGKSLRIHRDGLQYPAESAETISAHEHAPDDVRRVIFTSGSTGSPKPVPITRRMLTERLAIQNRALGEVFTRSTRRLCLMGINSILGYQMLVRTLAEGGLHCFQDADFARCVRGMALHEVQVLIGSPGQLGGFAAYGEQHPASFFLHWISL